MTDIGRLIAECAEWKARAEAAERNLRAAVGSVSSFKLATLRAELQNEYAARGQDIQSLNEKVEHWKGLAHEEAQKRSALGVANETLRAELQKERAHAKFASDEHGKADAECEAWRELAALGGDDDDQPAVPAYATAAQSTSELMARVHAAPTRANWGLELNKPARTEAEQRVLDACAELRGQALARMEDDYAFSEIAAAELARREAEK